MDRWRGGLGVVPRARDLEYLREAGLARAGRHVRRHRVRCSDDWKITLARRTFILRGVKDLSPLP